LFGGQGDSGAQQPGRGLAQFPAGSRWGHSLGAQRAAGLLEGAGGVGVGTAAAAFGELSDGREQVGRGGVGGCCRVSTGGSAQLRGRRRGGVLGLRPQGLPFVPAQSESVCPRTVPACRVRRSLGWAGLLQRRAWGERRRWPSAAGVGAG
jgi:hypothetical protein